MTMRRAMQEIASAATALIQRHVQSAINSQGASLGRAWAPHRPLTIASLGAHTLLRSRGVMFARLRTQSEIEPDAVTIRVGSDALTPDGYNLAKIHQQGVRGPILPRRGKYLRIPLLAPERSRGGRFRAHRAWWNPFMREAVTTTKKGQIVGLKQGRDYIKLKGIFPTADKDGYAIQPRPIALPTAQLQRDIAVIATQILVRHRRGAG
jgi:hypothetical protein